MSQMIIKSLWFLQVLTIWALLLLPVSVPANLAFNYADKLVHVALFFWLTISAAWVWQQARVSGLLLGFALLTELSQALTPWRSAEILDVLADALGIGLAWFCYYWRR